MKVYTALAKTEAADEYIFVYREKPTDEQVAKAVCNIENEEDLDYYLDTVSVDIEEHEIED